MRHEAGTNSLTGLHTRGYKHRVRLLANRWLSRFRATMGNEFGSGWAIGRAFAPNAEVRPLCHHIDEEFSKRSC
jgi:hypothetical protein